MKTALLKSVQLYDPDPKGVRDLFLCGGRVAAVDRELIPNLPDVAMPDGSSLTAFPGLVDQHAHFTGGGGECDFRSRALKLSLTDSATVGITMAVGLLGTDNATRNPKASLTRAKALNEEGLVVYCPTGAYDIPSSTVTSPLKDDVAYLSEIPGVRVILSDHRGGHSMFEQFTHMACQVRLTALTAGEPGVVYTHMGSEKRGLDLVYDLLGAADLPIWHFHPTHMSRWQSEAAAFVRKGRMVDFTVNVDPKKCALPVLRITEEVPLEHITINSDAGGSMP